MIKKNTLERFDYLSELPNRMWITEFDFNHANITERALDTGDFLRMAFSYPQVKFHYSRSLVVVLQIFQILNLIFRLTI